jgi:FlaA1/EpsC-like NDP-sugar epimerase
MQAHLIGSLVFLSSMYLLKSERVSRLLLQSFVVTSFAALLVQRFGLRAWLQYYRSRNFANRGRVLLVATPEGALSYLAFVRAHASIDVEVIGFLDPEDSVRRAVELERN